MKMLHHPYCTKSCAALGFIKGQLPDLEVIDLTSIKPDSQFIQDLLKKLNIKAFDLVRTSESVFQKKFEGMQLSEDEWVAAMVQHPILIQRPIFIHEDKAVIGRPVERAFELLK